MAKKYKDKTTGIEFEVVAIDNKEASKDSFEMSYILQFEDYVHFTSIPISYFNKMINEGDIEETKVELRMGDN
ncbi:hypothetical protein [Peptostreptococcus sp. D1]|uniref:hypothetical protein n=1 Tax=Peptostreptococcus sp. D1 TaxID=72304 RepID=UPI0008E651B0|nr:hypothetical protein [Peptostreptococcus sp. D1]SFE96332.1 hypothetical protein SAMN02910278_02173 [Peptostreptococcus sp. D1]